MEQTVKEQNYNIKEKADVSINNHGSIKNAIQFLKKELEELEESWSLYSSDCLGHGITCNRLLIDWLERMLIEPKNFN